MVEFTSSAYMYHTNLDRLFIVAVHVKVLQREGRWMYKFNVMLQNTKNSDKSSNIVWLYRFSR